MSSPQTCPVFGPTDLHGAEKNIFFRFSYFFIFSETVTGRYSKFAEIMSAIPFGDRSARLSFHSLCMKNNTKFSSDKYNHLQSSIVKLNIMYMDTHLF